MAANIIKSKIDDLSQKTNEVEISHQIITHVDKETELLKQKVLDKQESINQTINSIRSKMVRFNTWLTPEESLL